MVRDKDILVLTITYSATAMEHIYIGTFLN